MKIVASKTNLVNAIRRACCAVSSRPLVPVMNNILFSAKGDKLWLNATDNEISVSTCLPALIEEEGETTLPAKKIQAIVSALPEGDVFIESDSENISTLTCQKSFYKIHGLDAADFPRPSETVYDTTFEMKLRDLTRGIAKVSYAKSMDETRKQLNGVVLSIRSGMMTIAATDGRRLALVENPLEDDQAKDGDYILPNKAANELSKCIDEGEKVKISLNKAEVSFVTESTTLITKLVEGVYPNFRQVIPPNCGCRVTLQRTAFINVLKRVSLVVADSSGSIKLTFSQNELKVSASNSETGESSEPMEIAYDDEEVSVSCNHIFFLDPLNVMESDNITLEFGKQLSPVKILGDEGFLYMLMPMRG